MAQNAQGPKHACSRWPAAHQPDTTQCLKTGEPHSSEQQPGMKLQVCTLLCCHGLLCACHFVCLCIHPWSRCKVQSGGSTHHFSPGNCHLAAVLDKGMVPTGAEPYVIQENAETLPSQETWFLTTCTRNASRPFWNVPVQHTLKWARSGPKHHHHTGCTSITTTQGKHETQGASIELVCIMALLPTCEWESHGLAQNGHLCQHCKMCLFCEVVATACSKSPQACT
jgi:hypothetical protein